MKTAGSINQPYFFPYIGFFQMLSKSEVFVSLDDVSMITRGFVHRNFLMGGKEVKRFTIPIQKISQNKTIHETFTSDWPKYADRFWKKLRADYGTESYFCQVEQIWEQIDQSKDQSIADLSLETLKVTSRFFGFKTKFLKHSAIQPSASKGRDRILDICEHLSINEYWNLPGGRKLYSKELFSDRQIKLSFVEVQDYWKRNCNSGEKLHVSILDIIARYPRQDIIHYFSTEGR